jgi:hypothetical protein
MHRLIEGAQTSFSTRQFVQVPASA